MKHRRTTVRFPAAWLLAALTAICAYAHPESIQSPQEPADQPAAKQSASSSETATAGSAQSAPNVGPLTKDMTEPVPIYKPEPPYVEGARAQGVEGTITMMIVIGKDGSVHDVQLKKGIDSWLDESAVQTVRTWKFKPATLDGRPVPVRVLVEISFSLFGRGNAVYVPSRDVKHRFDDLKGVVPPKLIYSPDPEYTDKARRAKLEGTVTLIVDVDEKGRVCNVKEAGPKLGMGLDKKALKAVRKWKFQPATREGKPVGVSGTLKVKFKLPQGG